MSPAANRRALVIPLAFGAAVITGEAIGPAAALAAIALGVLLGWKLIPRFFLTLFAAGFAGAVAGGLIIGIGFRIAMRIVALLEPSRIPEFTVGGTLFIIVGVGAIFGGIFGIVASFTRKGFGAGRVGGALLAAGLVMAFLLIDSEIRGELLNLGVGGRLNLPMFGVIALGYGYVTQVIFDRAETEMIKESEGITV